MLRFGISLVAASLIALAGYSAFGQATVAAAPTLKTIAVVTAHAHHRAVSATSANSTAPAILL